MSLHGKVSGLEEAGLSTGRGSAVGLFHNPVGDPYTKTRMRATN
jgi:hypothetical protein